MSGDEAVEMSRQLARSEGIFTGTSGGGVLACALKKAKSLSRGSTMVVMLPDTGERYVRRLWSGACHRACHGACHRACPDAWHGA